MQLVCFTYFRDRLGICLSSMPARREGRSCSLYGHHVPDQLDTAAAVYEIGSVSISGTGLHLSSSWHAKPGGRRTVASADPPRTGCCHLVAGSASCQHPLHDDATSTLCILLLQE
jgi:hypothetical protein